MSAPQRLLISLLLLIVSGTAFPEEPARCTTTDDWSGEAALARQSGIPIMLLFSSDDCAYCERLKREVLRPLLETGSFIDRALLREFNIDRGGKITDFDGDRIRSRIFVKRYEIYATPTVLLVDYEGKAIADPIVGFNGANSYSEQLDEAISSAILTLAALSSPRLADHHPGGDPR